MSRSVSGPSVSFVVPVYNAAPHVGSCLSSISEQTVRDIEVLVVDDGSTDGSGMICDNAARNDPRISVIHIENCGVSHARNLGLGAARGEFLCFVDSDDRLSPVFAERMMALMTDNNADIAACGPTRIGFAGTVLWKQPRRQLVLKAEAALCGVFRRDLYCGWPWNKMFRTVALRRAGIQFDESLRYCEDLVFCFDAIARSNRLVYDSTEDLYFYRESELSVNRRVEGSGRFDRSYLGRLDADEKLLDRARRISPKVVRHAKANAFASNENIYRRLLRLGAPDRGSARLVTRNMARFLPFVLVCPGFGGPWTKIRFAAETLSALCGRIPLEKNPR